MAEDIILDIIDRLNRRWCWKDREREYWVSGGRSVNNYGNANSAKVSERDGRIRNKSIWPIKEGRPKRLIEGILLVEQEATVRWSRREGGQEGSGRSREAFAAGAGLPGLEASRQRCLAAFASCAAAGTNPCGKDPACT
jgi:hypothetical protein